MEMEAIKVALPGKGVAQPNRGKHQSGSDAGCGARSAEGRPSGEKAAAGKRKEERVS